MFKEIINADVLDGLGKLADGSVQCVVTSPPYWGLRDYGVDSQIGNEQTVQQYVAQTVKVFREVRRVLRTDGVLWLNMGDCYANDGKWGGETGGKQAYLPEADRKRCGRHKRRMGLKPKDLIMIPARVALALQADGWWLRSDVIWEKLNAMPESAKDRPSNTHEHLFLLTKAQRYFSDFNALRVPQKPSTVEPFTNTLSPNGSNCRSVWRFATQPYGGAHFATFPEELAKRCIRAGTSPRGACAACGAPLRRVLQPTKRYAEHLGKSHHDHSADGTQGMMQKKQSGWHSVTAEYETVGWEPTCQPGCKTGGEQTVPCVVLDPFLGSGTTVVVARNLNRSGIGIELNPEYCAMVEKRVSETTTQLEIEIL